MSKKSLQKYAGFWVRAAAFTFDVLIISAPTLGLEYFTKWSLSTYFGIDQDVHTGATNSFFTSLVVQLCVIFSYFGILQARFEGTLGKKVFGLKVVSSNRKQATLSQMLIRTVMAFPSVLFFMVGYIIVGFNKKKQGWHDQVADTYVIHQNSKIKTKQRTHTHTQRRAA